jgi:hypothetical protein
MPIDWAALFTSCSSEPPATREDLQQLADDLSRPLSPGEVESVLATISNPFPPNDPLWSKWRPLDPSAWRMPGGELPPAYESFLLSSNGGAVRNGEMEFRFFSTRDLRDAMLRYHVPEYMPMAIPLGLDGSGNLALFDARSPLVAGEFPVLVAAAGNLGFDDARLLADTFEQFCRRTLRVEAAFDSHAR